MGAAAPRLVVMGVCGSGKSSVGRRLGVRLGVNFLEGDDLHPARNIARMASGVPLSDRDRQDWLLALAAALRQARQQGRALVLACSALKRGYRELLCSDDDALHFIHLHGSPKLLAERMALRADHYMPASLLQSQLAILEPPAADERAITLDAALAVDQIVEAILAADVHRSIEIHEHNLSA